MKFPNKSYLAQLRKQYPVGTKIQLISMRDEKYPILPGTIRNDPGKEDEKPHKRTRLRRSGSAAPAAAERLKSI